MTLLRGINGELPMFSFLWRRVRARTKTILTSRLKRKVHYYLSKQCDVIFDRMNFIR